MKRELESLIGQFRTTSLTVLKKSDMMERIDVKFVFSYDLFGSVLEALSNDFLILEIDGKSYLQYDTVYFDTPEHKMYLDHHNGLLPRFKIRRRKYTATDSIYLEIKRKSNKGITRKIRIESERMSGPLTSVEKEFIREQTPFDPERLTESVSSSYRRITLISDSGLQKCTFDTMLTFNPESDNLQFGQKVIGEIKSKAGKRASLLFPVLKAHGIRPARFSKYCTGMLLTHNYLKYNNFKRRILSYSIVENE